jgi:hypothetical protein
MSASPRRNPSQEMAIRMVHVEDIELFFTKVDGKVKDVPKIIPEKLWMINLHGMI